MIYGITGLPGNGKTLYALAWLKERAEREGRPVWYHNVAGLSPELGWTPVPVERQTIHGAEVDVPQWWLAPSGAYVLIDEAQNCGFGVRPRGQVPEHARRLETHRHLGIDLVMITQSPMLLDSHDRALIGTHFHVVRNFGLARATIHEFQQLREDVLKRRTGSIRHEWRYPKAAYAWYRSSELHTHCARIPARLWLLGIVPLVLIALVWFMVQRWTGKVRGEADPAPTGPAASAVVPGPFGPGLRPSAPAPARVLTAAEYVEQFAPRVPGLAYTAPAYDEVTKPTQAPYPAACIASANRCQCYTQQGTHLDVGGDALCRAIARGGFFVAWQHQADGARTAAVAAAVPLVPGGHAQPGSLGGDPRAHILAAAK